MKKSDKVLIDITSNFSKIYIDSYINGQEVVMCKSEMTSVHSMKDDPTDVHTVSRFTKKVLTLVTKNEAIQYDQLHGAFIISFTDNWWGITYSGLYRGRAVHFPVTERNLWEALVSFTDGFTALCVKQNAIAMRK